MRLIMYQYQYIFIFLEAGQKYYITNNALGLWFTCFLWKTFSVSKCEVQKTEQSTKVVSVNFERNKILAYFNNKQGVKLELGLSGMRGQAT